jgi:hypothetical protein
MIEEQRRKGEGQDDVYARIVRDCDSSQRLCGRPGLAGKDGRERVRLVWSESCRFFFLSDKYNRFSEVCVHPQEYSLACADHFRRD